MTIDHRLAVYGTLAPGRSNHHQLAGLRGAWRDGVVTGVFVPTGWGATLGYPAVVLADDGPEVAVMVFESPDLPAHWDRLDAFEGSMYRRTRVRVAVDGGALDAWIYAATDPVAVIALAG